MRVSFRQSMAALALASSAVLGACAGGAPQGGEQDPVKEEIDGRTFESPERLSGAQIDAAAQKGVTWVVPDTVSWVQANGCAACHRAGGPLFGASLSAYTGYSVNTSLANGTGWLAQYMAGPEQQGNGSWTHGGSYTYTKSGYAVFGLSGYTEYTSTAYIADLQQGIDWAMAATPGYTFTFANDGKALAGKTTRYVPNDHVSPPFDPDWTHPTAQFAIATMTLLKKNPGLTPAQTSSYTAWANSLADSLEGQYARSNGGWPLYDIAYAVYGITAVGRNPSNDPIAAQMRDEILARNVAGQGWGDSGLAMNTFSTGEALFALCRLGVRSDQNAKVDSALTWLAAQQNPDGSFPFPGYTIDLSTIYAVMAMGCYGTLNVDVQETPTSAIVQPYQPVPATVTFDVKVTNTGYAQNTYDLTVAGSWAGITSLTQSKPQMVLMPNQSATSTITVTLAPAQPDSVVVPITTTVQYATASGPAQKTVKFDINIPNQPTPQAQATTTTITSGNGIIVNPGTNAPLAASVKLVATNAKLTQGTVTFFGGGSAIATVSADVNGNFTYSWPVPNNAPQGLQSFTASYNGYAGPNFVPNYAPSSANGQFTVGNGLGAACQFNIDCLSGFCADGVCCNSACNGTCQVCSAAAGASADGTCTNTDPDKDSVCADVDNCPATANPSQSDLDGDGLGDHCDPSTCVTIQRGLFGAVADTYISSEKADKPYDGNIALVAGKLASGALRKSLIKFDLSMLPAKATVQSASITFNRIYAYGAGDVSFYQILAPWAESTATWNNFGNPIAGSAATTISLDGVSTGAVAVNDNGLKALVQAWLNGTANHGVLINEVGTSFLGGYGFSNFSSCEDPLIGNRPKLDICVSKP